MLKAAPVYSTLLKNFSFVNHSFSTAMASCKKGLVLGFYDGITDTDIVLTDSATRFNDENSCKFSNLIKLSGLASKKGKSRVFYDVHKDYPAVAAVSLGKKDCGYNALEEVDETRESIRKAIANGVRQLSEAGFNFIEVDPCGDAEAAAEGANLCVYNYDELKAEKKPVPDLKCYDDTVKTEWENGCILSCAQNFARRLKETPANIMTPTRISELVCEYIGKLENIEIQVHDRAWAESKKMGSFLSVTNGSVEPPKFIEVIYKGDKSDNAEIALVGKGITFDAGGISLKPSPNMDAMRADMGGAACVLATVYAVAKLKLPLNVHVYTPCCENLPSGSATKPGDVVTAMNGKTIQVDNTDAEGRLVLADALCYAQTFKPKMIIDMATLTGAMIVSLGAAATGVFTNSDDLWNNMHDAGKSTGDRVWRMPLFQLYKKQMTDCQLADINNIGTAGRNAGSCTAAAFLKAGKSTGDRVWRMPLWNCYTNTMKDSQLADLLNSTISTGVKGGGSCLAAAFLKEFVQHEKWMHMDIAGVMSNKGEVPYLTKGMSGRPTRTIIEFLRNMAKK